MGWRLFHPSTASMNPIAERGRTYQAHAPAGATVRWIAANHSDDSLLLATVQDRLGTGARLVVERRLETALLVTVTDFANRLLRERDGVGNLWCTNAFGQLQQCRGSQDHPDLLYIAAQQLGQLALVFRFDIDSQRWTSHVESMSQNIST